MPAFKNIAEAIKPLAQHNTSVALRALATTQQKRMAELLNYSESSLSEWKEEHLEKAMQVIAAAGLKVVPKEDKTISAAEIAAYKLLARKAMDAVEPASDWGAL